MHVFEGEVIGKIVSPCRVDHGFQWDCVFVPKGEKRTFSEMGPDKDLISMRSKALQALAKSCLFALLPEVIEVQSKFHHLY